MRDRVFMDTNVLIYAYSDTEPEKKEKSLIILEQEDVMISTQVINEFIWNMYNKFQIDIEALNDLTDRLFNRFKVSLIDKNTISRALDLVQQLKYSYWDSLIIASALIHDCSSLYTEDMQHDQIIENKLRIFNPFMGM